MRFGYAIVPAPPLSMLPLLELLRRQRALQQELHLLHGAASELQRVLWLIGRELRGPQEDRAERTSWIECDSIGTRYATKQRASVQLLLLLLPEEAAEGTSCLAMRRYLDAECDSAPTRGAPAARACATQGCSSRSRRVFAAESHGRRPGPFGEGVAVASGRRGGPREPGTRRRCSL